MGVVKQERPSVALHLKSGAGTTLGAEKRV